MQPWIEAMRAKLDSDAGRAQYRLHKQTVEPAFGIIKNVLGFRQFTLRGHAKVRGECNWSIWPTTPSDCTGWR